MIDLIKFSRGGMDQDNSRDSDKRDPNDYDEAFNFRTSGTSAGEGGNGTNYESHVKVSGPRPAGFNKCVGGRPFEHIRRAYGLIYNSNGNNLIVEYDHDTEQETTLFTNKTDSGGVDILPLDPARYITEVQLVDNKFLVFIDSTKRVCMINIEKLRNKEYGIIKYDDFSLLKPQPMLPVLPEYGDDSSRSVNLLRQGLYQFISQFIYGDYQYSAWSMMSKRVVPVYESTTGTDVTKANYLKVSVHIGNDRVEEISVGARTGLYTWYEVKRISRKKVLAITNTAIDVARGIYEAYEPNTGYYTFAFYNDGNYNAIPALETDLLNDVVPEEAGTMEVINSTLIALSDLKEGKLRPEVDMSFSVSSYEIGLTYNEVENPEALKVRYSMERKGGPVEPYEQVYLWFSGKPKANDTVYVPVVDNNDKKTILHEYPLTVVVNEQDNLLKMVQRYATGIPYSSVRTESNGEVRLTFSLHRVTEHAGKWEVILAPKIVLANAGDGSSTSKPALKQGSAYQGALAYYDDYGRPFPINTDSSFIVRTPTYAELKGKAPRIDWKIKNAPPKGAKYYNILLSQNNTHEKTLFVTGKESGSAADYVILYINPLNKFNENNSASVLSYGFAKGDRVTLHYMEDGANLKTWFDGTAQKAIDVEVLSFEPVKEEDPSEVINYQLKIRKSADLVIADIQNKDIMVEIYTPRRRDTVNQDGDTVITTPFFETGDRFAIVDGKHSVTQGSITEGDVYLKTRPYVGAVDPNSLFNVIVEDFHFSDYYVSNFYSFGRVRTYFDTPEEVYLGSSIRYGEVYEKGSRINGLNRFYLENIYGDGPGETSSSYGRVTKMEQRGGYLVVLQEINNGHIPVYKSILEDEEGQQNVAVSTRLFGSIRYNQAGNVGIGGEQTAFARSHNGTVYFVDPNNSMPMRDGFDGLKPIPGKMSKFFQQVLHNAFRANKKVILYYNDFQKELVVTLENDNDVLFSVAMDTSNVEILEDFPAPTALGITLLTQPAKGTVTYNTATGKATYQSGAGATGTDNFTYQFTVDGIVITKRACIAIEVAPPADVDQFQFVDAPNQEINTLVESNGVLISTGTTIPVAYTLTGGEIQINGGAWTSANGFLQDDDFVVVRGYSSQFYETDHLVTLTVGTQSDQFNIMTRMAPDATADAFAFIDVTDKDTGTWIESNAVTITGIEVAVSIAVTGGEYQINGGAWTSVSGAVNNGDTVKVRGMSSASYATTTQVTLNAGEQLDTFSIRTKEDVTVNPFQFTDSINNELTTAVESELITIEGITIAVPISIVGGEYQINGGSWTSAAGTVANGNTVRVRVTTSGSYETDAQTTLTAGGTSATFIASTRTADTIPDAFTFTDVLNAEPSTTVPSNEITISGIEVAVPISITGGEYQVDGGAFTSAAGMVLNGRVIRVRVTSSAGYESAVSATLTVNGVSDTFTATTREADTTADAFAFTDATGREVNTVAESDIITISGIEIPVPITVTGGEYRINAGAWTSAAGTVSNGDSVQVRGTSSANYFSTVNVVLNAGEQLDTFSITTRVAVSVPVTITVDYGIDPITQSGIIFNRNGVEAYRQSSEVAGYVLTNTFYEGDTVVISNFTYGTAMPWEEASQVQLQVKLNGVTRFMNPPATVQSGDLQSDSAFVIPAGSTSIEASSIGTSEAVGYVTKVLNVTTNTQQAKMTVTDTTVPKTVLILNNSLQNTGGVQIFPYNLFVDANPQTLLVENVSGTNSMDVTVNGGSVVNIPAGGSQSFTGITKDSINLTLTQI